MREPLLESVENHRVVAGGMASTRADGPNGVFYLTTPGGVEMQVIASNGAGWDHVSACPRFQKRTPTWEEMTWLKDQFFDPEEVVIQYHPPRSRYINNHPFVLHLWRPQGVKVPTPPDWMVGVKARKRHAGNINERNTP